MAVVYRQRGGDRTNRQQKTNSGGDETGNGRDNKGGALGRYREDRTGRHRGIRQQDKRDGTRDGRDNRQREGKNRAGQKDGRRDRGDQGPPTGAATQVAAE